MTGDGVAGATLDPAQHALELVVGECFDLAAVVADEVVVVLAVRVNGFESCGAVTDVDPLHESLPGQLLERPVDAGDPDSPSLGPEAVEDLLGGQAAVLATEKLDDRAAGGAVAVTLRKERGDRRLGPIRAFLRHLG